MENSNQIPQTPTNSGASNYYFPLSYLPKLFSSIPSFLPFSFNKYEAPSSVNQTSISIFHKNFTSESITSYIDNVIVKKNKIMIQHTYLFQNIPAFLQLIATLMIQAYRCTVQLVDQFFVNECLQKPLSIILTEKMWKVLSMIVNKKLFVFENQKDDRFFNEVSQSFIFRSEFSEKLFLLITNRSNFITLDCLHKFYQNLVLNDVNTQINAGSIAFSYYGGKIFQIKQKDFSNSFDESIGIINNYFQKSNVIVNFIQRNLQTQFNLRDDQLLENYLKLMGNFKQTNLAGFLDNLSGFIFADSDEIEQKTFINRVQSFHSNNNSTIIFSLFEIIKTELDLIQSQEFSAFFYSKEEIQLSNQEKDLQSNYYLKTIDKLLNKCVYNGEEQCNCKQCLCIRRNRNSAQESQQRKRQALQQIGPLQEKCDHYQKRIEELEGENHILQQIIEKIAHNSIKDDQFCQIITEVIEPFSQVIGSKLEE